MIFSGKYRFYLLKTAMIKPFKRILGLAASFVEKLIPDRTLNRAKALWDSKARENARYFVYTKTKSGESVGDLELKDTGFSDYEKYVIKDDVLSTRLRPFSEKKVLEIGCGIGRMTEFFAEDFSNVFGIDISQEMVKNASRRLMSFTNVLVFVNDGASYPFKDNFFDFVFSYLVFQHISNVSDVEKNFLSIYRVLKPGGIAKLQFRTGPGIRKWQWSYGLSLNDGSARELATRVGFKVLKSETEEIKNLWLWLKK